MNPNATLPGLDAAWSAYRSLAATARQQKKALQSFTQLALGLSIVGALLAAVGQHYPATQELLGKASAVVLAIAAFLSAQSVAGNRDRIWIRTRAAAESLKSAIYLYRASVTPFKGPDRAEELEKRVQKTLEQVNDVERRLPEGKDTEPPPSALIVSKYISERVDDQIRWYEQRSVEYQKKSDRAKVVTFVAGLASALLAALPGMFPAGWVALATTAVASLTAYAKNQRYQQLIGMYQATALRLRALKARWEAGGKTDADIEDRDKFIQACEETLAAESSAWVAQWSEQPARP
jgi:hypothetical protein